MGQVTRTLTVMAVVLLLGACAGSQEDAEDLPVERVWECDCEGFTMDAFGIPSVREYTENRCSVKNPSDDDCACSATESACSTRDAGQ